MKKNINLLLCFIGLLLLISSILIYLQFNSVKPLQIALNAVGATCIAFGVSNLYNIFIKIGRNQRNTILRRMTKEI